MVVQEYDDQWPKYFAAIGEVFRAHLSSVEAIEHVGSTSVPGMCAKPIIDIDIIVGGDKEFVTTKTELESLGYVHNGNQGVEGREVFIRNGNNGHKVLDGIRHHLYVCKRDSAELSRHLRFRDALRNDASLREAYRAIKKDILTEVGEDNRAGYVEKKERAYGWFFENVLDKGNRSSP